MNRQELILAIAQVCHAGNKAWCEANGDNSIKEWNEAEQWQRDSSIRGVTFRMANPDAGHDAQHNAWMEEKLSQGWVHGAVKDPEAKTHPCLVSYEQLPVADQHKDSLFCAVVDSLRDFPTTD